MRLRKLLEAGGFDESLASTTDRDICIRLADLGSVRYGSLPEHLVHHYAEDDRIRLSTPGGDAKCAGLKQFYRKYGSRMTVDQHAAFIERSRNTYDCDPISTTPVFSPTISDPGQNQNVDGKLDLVVGVITSPNVDNVARLIDSLIIKFSNQKGVVLRVLLLENGLHDPTSRAELRESCQQRVTQGTGH